jgi:membrane protein DedA with SNARE-associated domain
MITIEHFGNFITSHAYLGYSIIVLGIIIEGETFAILSGIFSHLGFLNVYLSIISILLGGALKSIFGYLIGYYIQKNHSNKKLISNIEEKINNFLPKFENKKFLYIFLSRFLLLGMNSFILIFSGYKKINLKIFIKAEILSLILWTTLTVVVGYLFSYAALSFTKDLKNFIIIILILFIILFIIEKIASFILRLFKY